MTLLPVKGPLRTQIVQGGCVFMWGVHVCVRARVCVCLLIASALGPWAKNCAIMCVKSCVQGVRIQVAKGVMSVQCAMQHKCCDIGSIRHA
jgi:hypothetical protein